jgi:hypothetical protein
MGSKTTITKVTLFDETDPPAIDPIRLRSPKIDSTHASPATLADRYRETEVLDCYDHLSRTEPYIKVYADRDSLPYPDADADGAGGLLPPRPDGYVGLGCVVAAEDDPVLISGVVIKSKTLSRSGTDCLKLNIEPAEQN